ncbi:phosphate/phosphite/phosphonate ABC transporter substrate-binding protein [Pseudofrankia inefficax]|uniref:Phosphonate ABC transporter, periplasmic phosphonate-binding protein n=1 Tax=Pseudofrankia inefficax (strain DSM 45817 / CECT 9037 / DDB 130130 / EuI1c) TaxID=298654 RepID=E3J452_PSEI1|nr:phosphate/phosphite/phosphonate ABC transporter substrate-binding protein [Pseudofrankia inefficax]ADP81831.1 phosphonate ABC transporter, periplasmic phosphonate-binding protein [Pseudofrankia inefficax]
MIRRLRTSAMIAGVAALSLAAVAACGSSDGGSTTAASSSSPAETGTFADSPGTIVFATVPDQAGSDSNWKPLEEYIAKQTGYKVKFFPTSDYTALIAAAVAGKVDVAAFSGLTYVNATNKGAKQQVVSAVIASAGLTDPGYYSEAIVPKGSDITSVAGFKGKTVCFVSKSSTSGFLFPMLALNKAGINIEASGADASGNPTFADFKASFAGAHDKSVQAVASKQCDAGFAEDSEAEAAAKDGSVTVLDKQYVPGGPITISTALPKSVQAKLTSALSSVTLDQISAAGITVTDGFKSSFQAAKPETDAYYDTIRSICTKVTAAKCAK